MSIVPVKNLTLFAGSDYRCQGYLTDNGSPISMAGWQFQADLKATKSGAVLASFTFEEVTNGTNTGYVRKLSRTVINSLPVDDGVWDQFYIADGVRTKMLEGTWKVDRAVTQEPTV